MTGSPSSLGGKRSASSVCGSVVPEENTTERIPEPVIAALLRWALFYIYTAADDILAARQEWQYLISRPLTCRRVEARELLREFVDRRRAAGRGLPERREDIGCGRSSRERDRLLGGRLNLYMLSRLVGFDVTLIYRGSVLSGLIEDAVRELGFESGGLDTPITVSPRSGRPWKESFDFWEVETESSNLLAACYIVIAYLTGARDSEVQGLERGCHFTEPSADGLVVRHKVRGWVVKRKNGGRMPAVWVALPEVADAIAVLERLTEHPRLFTNRTGAAPSPGRGYPPNDQRVRRPCEHDRRAVRSAAHSSDDVRERRR